VCRYMARFIFLVISVTCSLSPPRYVSLSLAPSLGLCVSKQYTREHRRTSPVLHSVITRARTHTHAHTHTHTHTQHILSLQNTNIQGGRKKKKGKVSAQHIPLLQNIFSMYMLGAQAHVARSSYATGSFRSLPIAAPDLVCDDECFCSSSYFNSIIRRSDLGLTWEDVLANTCRTEEDLIEMLRHPVTVVVGVYSRPGFFEHVTSAILSSTANVTRLWIVCNGSPHLETFQTMTENLKRKTTRVQVDFFSASLEVGYYDRFLRVLVAQSKYLAFIDEDMQVAPRFLEICLRALSTKKIGLIGAQGYRAGKPTTWRDAKYMYFSLPIPPFLFLPIPPPPCGPPRSVSLPLCLSLCLSPFKTSTVTIAPKERTMTACMQLEDVA
jgi:hypothetical protein